MEYLDRLLICSDCGAEFIFTAGEQLFFFEKQFKNDPKRCKPCKGKRVAAVVPRPGASLSAASAARTETRTECSACGVGTTVPFKPTQGRPVLCRQCFQNRQVPALAASAKGRGLPSARAELNNATAKLIAAASNSEHRAAVSVDRSAAPARA